MKQRNDYLLIAWLIESVQSINALLSMWFILLFFTHGLAIRQYWITWPALTSNLYLWTNALPNWNASSGAIQRTPKLCEFVVSCRAKRLICKEFKRRLLLFNFINERPWNVSPTKHTLRSNFSNRNIKIDVVGGGFVSNEIRTYRWSVRTLVVVWTRVCACGRSRAHKGWNYLPFHALF